jgi:hypothetical protein
MEENDVSLPKGKQATSSTAAWQSLLQLWMNGRWLASARIGTCQHLLAAESIELARLRKHASAHATCCFQ